MDSSSDVYRTIGVPSAIAISRRKVAQSVGRSVTNCVSSLVLGCNAVLIVVSLYWTYFVSRSFPIKLIHQIDILRFSIFKYVRLWRPEISSRDFLKDRSRSIVNLVTIGEYGGFLVADFSIFRPICATSVKREHWRNDRIVFRRGTLSFDGVRFSPHVSALILYVFRSFVSLSATSCGDVLIESQI